MPEDKGTKTGTETGNEGAKEAPTSFEDFLAGQDETVRGLYEDHVKGLKGALGSERETRKELERQLRDLAGKAEKGSEAEAKLTKLADDLGETTTRAEFYEAAHDAGVRNLKLAFLVARQDGLIDSRGRMDFERLRKGYPELFAGQQTPSGNAGSGTQKPPSTRSMNDFIRAAAGRR